METLEQIRKFQEFIELHYLPFLMERVGRGEHYLVIDFRDLSRYDPTLAELLLEQPEEVIKAAELAVQQSDIAAEAKDFRVRFSDLPVTQDIFIRTIRSQHIGKFISTKGVVRQKSDVRPQVTSTKFECPSCGNIISVLQLDTRFKEPSRCGCGRKGKFRLVGKELVDAQRIVLEEAPESLEGGEQPKRIDIFLKQDLVSPIGDKKTNPGSKILINGVVKEIPIILRTGGQSIRYDLYIEANYVKTLEQDFTDIEITEEEERRIKELAQDPLVYEKLIQSIAPSIYGMDRIKEAIMLQLMGGVRKTRDDGVVTRGDMHVLLIGDPGAAKSQLLKRAKIIAPKGRYVSGKGATGAGLTAAVVKDEFLRGWALEAGALVLSSSGFCMIDELDKMNKEDRDAMHEALEQQTISISKANIQATLKAETTVLAAANPKLGRFDPYDIIAKQIDLPPTLINRFDLIFPIKDLPDREKDEKMASFILALHKQTDTRKPLVETSLLRKYIAYARTRVSPKLTEGAVEEIKEYYVSMRASGSTEEGLIKTIPISARQLEALVRLTESNARVRLSEIATREDAKRGINLLDYCLRQVGLDRETGRIDIDRIATGIPTSQRSNIHLVKEIIAELEDRLGKTVPIEDVLREATTKGMSEGKLEEILEQLKRSGDLFEPRRGFVSRI
ncbi:minichromosome maintenance protein MCM [Candidatus Woesearchaeota archaeon]|nr:minichromosome maintenance protein MCM [Candidatus Woesearchaeota archaeon]